MKYNALAKWAASMFVVVGLAACSAEEPEQASEPTPEPVTVGGMTIDDPAVLAAMAERQALKDPEGPGAQAYEEVCAGCHEGQVPKAPHTSMLEIMSPDSIFKALDEGVMQAESGDLSRDQKRAVAEYLSGTRIGQQVAYPVVMCQDDALAFDYDDTPLVPAWGMTRGNTRMMPASNINRDNVASLQLKWAFAYPEAVRARSQPMAAGGALYVGSHNGDVLALDADTGCVRWQFQASAEVRTGVVIDEWEAGDTDAQPLAYFGDLLGNVYAINAVTGEQVWRHRPDDHPSATITGTPSLFDGKLYVTVSSLEVTPAMYPTYECCTFRGSAVAYDAASGDVVWQTFTIDEEPQLLGQNRSGTDNYGPSGAPSWNSPAIDTERNQLYFGTGENYSSPATLTSDAIFALDLDTGAINWSFQATPNDAWNQACDMPNDDNCPDEDGPDFDFGAAVVYAEDSNGKGYVLGGQKSGMVHALDPDTGDILWQQKVGRGGIQGGIHFGMGVEGDTVFVPVTDMPDGREYPEPRRPGLYALNLMTGEYIWKAPADDVCEGRFGCAPGISASVSVSPGLVYAGAMDGRMRVHNTETGEILWDYDSTVQYATLSGEPASGGSFGGAVGPLVKGNRLYMNSGYGIYFHMPGNVLLAFELPEEQAAHDSAE